MSTLDDVKLDPNDPVVSYVKARYAIDESISSRKERRMARLKVANYLGGELEFGNVGKTRVIFPNKRSVRF